MTVSDVTADQEDRKEITSGLGEFESTFSGERFWSVVRIRSRALRLPEEERLMRCSLRQVEHRQHGFELRPIELRRVKARDVDPPRIPRLRLILFGKTADGLLQQSAAECISRCRTIHRRWC